MEMETSTEPMDPLAPSVAALGAQPEGGCREQGTSPHGPLAARAKAVRALILCLVF